ncbi:MAG: type 1 glutamine amidotransferase, partial [Patescibacteria group bacterium]
MDNRTRIAMKNLLVFQHVGRESPINIATYAADRGIGLRVVRLWKKEPIPDVSGYDALIVMGGPMGAYDEDDGKPEEFTAIKQNLGVLPILGICLGAHLIASALGSNVYPHTPSGKRIKEIGYDTVELTEEGKQSPLFRGLPSPLTVFQWHGDTFDLPSGATLLATSKLCANQAYQIGNAYGIQFHVEITPEFVDEWLRDDAAWTGTDHELNARRVVEDSR